MRPSSRREFLKSSVTAVCAASVVDVGIVRALPAATLATAPDKFPADSPLPIKKGVWMEMLPASLSLAERFKMARDVGFEVIQAPTEPDDRKAEEIKKAADDAKIRIDSVMNMDHWKYPRNAHVVRERQTVGIGCGVAGARGGGPEDVVP